MRRLLAPLAVALLLVACSADTEPDFQSVDALFEAAGGAAWCDGELNVTLAPFVGNCGDPATDARVVLGVGDGGSELRASIDGARDLLDEDGQLLLVPADPDREFGWQLRTRDRALLEAAQGQLGGVILDTVGDIDAWLGGASA